MSGRVRALWGLIIGLAAAGAMNALAGEEAAGMHEIVIGTGFAQAEGRYHLFYDTDGPHGYGIAYAYSEDGLRWVKPDLDLVQVGEDRPRNLLDIRAGGEGSLYDRGRFCDAER